ncbi:Hypothetical predicted protein, partial [Paramuricea clavata]
MEFEAPGDEHGRTRLVIDEETLEMLKYFFLHKSMDSSKKEKLPLIKECANRAKLSEHQVKSMDSSKKEKLPLIKECANRAKLSEHQVKHWINNYKSKISGRISARKAKSKLIRKRSGFNMFASESLLK